MLIVRLVSDDDYDQIIETSVTVNSSPAQDCTYP